MEKIKLPRSSYEEIKKIIVSYGAINKPAGLDDIVRASGIPKTIVSANNAFLSSIQIIEGGNRKLITGKGLKLARALEHEILGEVQSSWTEIIYENDFLTKMIQAVRIRKGMDVSQLENHIAFSSGEQKTNSVMTGAKAVVDILIASGQMTLEGDKLLATTKTSDPVEIPNNSSDETQRDVEHLHVQPAKVIALDKQVEGSFNLKIELLITANPNELEGLGKKIKSIIDELNVSE